MQIQIRVRLSSGVAIYCDSGSDGSVWPKNLQIIKIRNIGEHTKNFLTVQNTGQKFLIVENPESKMKCLGTRETCTIKIHQNRKISPCCKIPTRTEAVRISLTGEYPGGT
jgi:hypothetical protein